MNFVVGCRVLAVHKLASGMIKAAFPYAFAIMVSDNMAQSLNLSLGALVLPDVNF